MKTYCYQFYIGITDKDNTNQMHSLELLNKKIEEVAITKEIPFSSIICKGGYLHESGAFVVEDSIKIVSVRNINEDILNSFCNDIKKKFNQEAILVTRRVLEQEYK